MKNNSFDEIAKVLLGAEKIVLYPHIGMDGDAVGSCSALALGLIQKGKDASVYVTENIPGNLAFMDLGFFHSDESRAKAADISVCVDCGDLTRIKGREEAFLSAETTVCLDHHMTSEPFCEYSYIDGNQAATGQIVYECLKAMNVEFTKEIADRLFASITSDTGNFQYSNTQKKSFDIASEMLDYGLNPNEISISLYESNRLEKIRIESRAIDKMESICGGKVLIANVTQKMLRETGAVMDETNGIVATMRSVGGCEVAVLLKEYKKDEIKVSMRSKNCCDVAKIAASFGGGGHIRAAGFTLSCNMAEAVETIKKTFIEEMGSLDD